MSDDITESTVCSDIRWDAQHEIAWCVLTSEDHSGAEAHANVDGLARLRDRLGRQKIRVLVDIRNVRTVTRDARNFYAGEFTASVQRSTALVTGDMVSRVLANFFMGLNKPASPTRMFNDPNAAIEWLQDFPSD